MAETIISVKNLNKDFLVKRKESGFGGAIRTLLNPKFEKVSAINDISFEVSKGEIIAFIGPNGAGKSTTIKVLTGILYPTSGKVSVLGMTPWEKRQTLAFKIGSVFGQRPQLWYHLPPQDTFDLFAKIYEVDPKDYHERLDFLISAFEIQDFLTIPVRKLSLGQRMRSEIVASLIHNPEVLFLDEPTIGLDIIAKQSIREVLRKINREHKTTIFLTSHDVADIEALCERTVIINHGQIIFDDQTENLRKQYLSTKVIKADFETPISDFNPKFGKILNKSKFSITIEIDAKKDSVNELLDIFLSKYKVADLVITDTPLEEIISSIYLEAKHD